MGPSGSGKSTLMHILAGLDQPTVGHVVDRRRRARRPRRQGAHRAAPRQDRLHLPVVQPAAGADRRGEHRAAADDRRPRARRRRGSTQLHRRRSASATACTHRPSELSGGQQQRVAVARALVTRPAVVFADEPTGNLDSKASSDEVLQLLRRSVDEFGQTVVMVTHDAERRGVRRPRRRAGRRPDRPRRRRRHRGRGAELLKRSPDAALTLRGLAARKLRTALTALAVVLGVALISGTYIFTDTINRSFDDDLQRRRTRASTSRSRRSRRSTAATTATAAAARRRACSTQVRAVARRRRGRGRRLRPTATILDKHGKRIGARRRAELHRLGAADQRFDPFNYVAGPRRRATADEVAIDKATADEEGFKVGDTVARRRRAAAQAVYRLVGIAQVRRRRLVRRRQRSRSCTLPEAQRVPASDGRFDEIDVAAEPGRVARRSCEARIARGAAGGTRDRAHRQQQAEPAVRRHPATTLASCSTRCWSSPASRCSSAPSSSSTRSRSPSPSARASSRCCARSAPSRRQVLRSVLVEGAARRRRRRRSLGLLARHRARRRGCEALFKALGVDLPSSGHGHRDAHDRRLAARRHARHAVVEPRRRRCARRACRRSPRCARAPCCRGRAAAGCVTPLASCSWRSASALIAARAVRRRRAAASAARACSALGAALVSSASRCCSPRLVRPARVGGRRAARALRGVTGRLARENADAPTRPHRGHRRRADDRRGAGRVRRDLRRRAAKARSHERSTSGSQRRSSSSRTATASRRSRPAARRRSATVPGVQRRLADALQPGARSRAARATQRRPGVDPRRSASSTARRGRRARRRRCARCGRRRRRGREELAEGPRHQGGRDARGARRRRRATCR